MNEQILKSLVLTMVARDPGVTPEERQTIIQQLSSPGAWERMSRGPGGKALVAVLSKFLALSPQAQILLGLAGFGIASYFKSKADDKSKIVKYNDKIKLYELNDYGKN